MQTLEKDLRDWVKAWNENPKPFIWTKTAEDILESIARYLKRINGSGKLSSASFLCQHSATETASPAQSIRPVRRNRYGQPSEQLRCMLVV